MQPSPDYDVVIIGAGPAGSTAAIAYKRASLQLRVVLVDKAIFPRDKVCGDGLGPGVLALLDELDLSAAASGEKQIASVEVRGPRNTVAEGPLPPLDHKGESGTERGLSPLPLRLAR